MHRASFVIPALLVVQAFGQDAFGQDSVTRTYTFTHLASMQEFGEITTLMRTAASLQAATVSAPQTLTVTGTAAQIGVTDWLFQELDQPPQGQPSVAHQYNVSTDDVVRVFYLPSTASVQDFQEMINAVRTIGEIRIAYGENEQRAFLLRGTRAQIAHAEFMLNDLTQTNHTAGPREYQLTANDVTQVFYLTHAASIQDFQEIGNMVRTIGDIRSVAAVNAPRALLVRATPNQIPLAAWLVGEFEQSQTAPAAPSYTAATDDVVRVFYFPSTSTVQEFQSAANAVRTGAQLRRAVAISTRRAFTVRGTTSQTALAEKLVADLSKPAP